MLMAGLDGIKRKIDPRGNDTRFIVNQLNQVVREVSPEVVPSSGVRYQKDFYYDANNNLTTSVCDAAGRTVGGHYRALQIQPPVGRITSSRVLREFDVSSSF